jgi:carbamoyltransferase
MTQRIGLKPNEEEYILMGMAALGNPNKLTRDLLTDFVALPNDDYQLPFRIKNNLHRGCESWRQDLNTMNDRFNIAAATQAVYELAFERILQTAMSTTNSRNLVLMGGCALNCAANHIAFKYFDRVWIMPAPGDSGSSIGAVLADRKQHTTWPGPYLGYDMGYTATNREIVEYITNHKICGVARGRAEFGPRALGNRSLVADPRGPQVKDRVNMIKGRENFRPFAPAILEEHADRYFEMPTEKTPYMQFTAKCRKPDSYPAIIHADGTSRVQTVGKNDNPEFRALLETWYDLTGCPMLLNTSLNIKGKPMVNDHADRLNWQAKHGLPVFN